MQITPICLLCVMIGLFHLLFYQQIVVEGLAVVLLADYLLDGCLCFLTLVYFVSMLLNGAPLINITSSGGWVVSLLIVV